MQIQDQDSDREQSVKLDQVGNVEWVLGIPKFKSSPSYDDHCIDTVRNVTTRFVQQTFIAKIHSQD